mmetsp:Transcript_26234/g.51520  ORF Transcript_26234/g.51520 Transcript_26234/m.51520 type:complete len:95 (+) Transcript_26234:163-447(+)
MEWWILWMHLQHLVVVVLLGRKREERQLEGDDREKTCFTSFKRTFLVKFLYRRPCGESPQYLRISIMRQSQNLILQQGGSERKCLRTMGGEITL